MSLDFSAIIPAPGFCLGISCADEQLARLNFLEPCQVLMPTTPLAVEVARQLQAWLSEPGFVFDLPLKPQGTPFQRRVWEGIAAIPLAQTCSYGELAKVLDTAPRAVGQACGANPLPVIVPCHRVLAANGGLGGFARHGGGFLLEVKRCLLAHERGE